MMPLIPIICLPLLDAHPLEVFTAGMTRSPSAVEAMVVDAGTTMETVWVELPVAVTCIVA